MDYKNANLSIEQRVADLLKRMTIEEKIGQLGQSPMLDYPNRREEYLSDLRKARYGSRILAYTAFSGNAPREEIYASEMNEIQRVSMEESRLGIPLIIARDVIYGQETVLPIPLAQAASFNPSLVEEAYTCVAREAASFGINWTFSPMMDVARDPRWGRVIETSGEDPYLTSVMIEGVIRGFQGKDLTAKESLVACAKHFCAYAGAEGGRDYNTTDFSENTLHNTILPPFKAAIDAGVQSFMSGFNDLGGTPVSGSKELIQSGELVIPKSKLTLIYGPSGCGKTSLLENIIGLSDDLQATFITDGKRGHLDDRLSFFFGRTHYVSQRVSCSNVSIAEFLDCDVKLTLVYSILNNLQLCDPSDKTYISKMIGENGSFLSGGELQRLNLAKAFLSGSEILILDEPTSAVNTKSEERLLEILENSNKTILIISHSDLFIATVKNRYLISNGKIELEK